MEDIFSSNFDNDCHFLGFFTSELEMDIAGSGRNDRNSCSRTRFRFRDPHSKQGRDDEYRERRHKRDKPTQEWIPPSQRSSSTPSSSSSDNRQATESRPRLHHLPSCIMPNPESVRGVICILCMTEAEVIKEDIATIRNKTTKQMKGMHLNRSLIWLSECRGWKVSSRVSVHAEPGAGGKPQRPGATLGPHHDGALPKRSVDLGRRRDDDEVSLLASDEGIPHLPQVGQDLSEVCFNPVPDVTTKWSPHDVITSCVSKYFSNKPIKKPFQLRS